MLKLFIALSLVTLVLGQLFTFPSFTFGNWWGGLFGPQQVVDTIHGLSVQYDDEHDLVILFNRTDCFLVEAQGEATWDQVIRHADDLHKFTEAVYQNIHQGTGVADITQQAAADYHSRLEQWDCRGKRIHKVVYTLA